MLCSFFKSIHFLRCFRIVLHDHGILFLLADLSLESADFYTLAPTNFSPSRWTLVIVETHAKNFPSRSSNAEDSNVELDFMKKFHDFFCQAWYFRLIKTSNVRSSYRYEKYSYRFDIFDAVYNTHARKALRLISYSHLYFANFSDPSFILEFVSEDFLVTITN